MLSLVVGTEISFFRSLKEGLTTDLNLTRERKDNQQMSISVIKTRYPDEVSD